VATASGSIGVWEVPDTLRWEKNLGTKIGAMAWSPDGAGQQRIAVAGDDGRVRMLDALTGQQVLVYTGHGQAHVLSVTWATNAYSPTSVASGDSDGIIKIWNGDTGETLFTFPQAAPVRGLAFGGLYLIAVGTQPGGTYNIWDTQAGHDVMRFSNNNLNIPYGNDNGSLVEGALISVSWSSDATYVTAGDTNGNVQVLSDTQCSCWLYQAGFHAHRGAVNGIAWASDNQRFATASDDGTVQLWRAGTWAHLKTFTNPDRARVKSVSWAPDGTALIAGDSAGRVALWEVAS
jgi:WD40 repeat protein